MTDLLIKNATLTTGDRGWLLCRDGRVAVMGHGDSPDFETSAETIDAEGLLMLPGFIDVHVHGGNGSEAMDATPEALATMAQFYATHGVTAFLATTWTDTPKRITAAMEAIAISQGSQPNGATIVGAHMEGPYLNPKMCGAQNLSYIRRALRDEVTPLLDLNVIRLMALAPEYDENHWLIRECVRRGITVSAAHTGATYAQICHAVELGLSQTTHTYNAMTGLHHREPGTLGAALSIPSIYCELIADNIHVHPTAMQILFAAKGVDRVILISDGIRGAGLPDGEYPVDEKRVIIVKNGAARLPDGTLAGSILTMNDGLRNFAEATHQPISALWKTTSLNAARSIGISDRKGSLEIGKDADLVLVDEQVNVYLTVVEGRIVYTKST